ncbi:MAG: GvpL/GvpF family gas vesicle protein [Longimicrobiales bacterium]
MSRQRRLDRDPVLRGDVASASPTVAAAQPGDDSASHSGAVTDDTSGLYLFGIGRTGGWRALRSGSSQSEELTKVRFRDLEALARPVAFSTPALDAAALQWHQRAIESAMRHGTVLPLPFGIVFKGRRALIRFLQEQYLALDEGLALLDGHWELRLHIGPAKGEPGPALVDIATDVYAELRRLARAALPFPKLQGRLLGAAFLVERDAWIKFVERADDLIGAHADLSFDLTGPWAAYDFVRLVRND